MRSLPEIFASWIHKDGGSCIMTSVQIFLRRTRREARGDLIAAEVVLAVGDRSRCRFRSATHRPPDTSARFAPPGTGEQVTVPVRTQGFALLHRECLPYGRLYSPHDHGRRPIPPDPSRPTPRPVRRLQPDDRRRIDRGGLFVAPHGPPSSHRGPRDTKWQPPRRAEPTAVGDHSPGAPGPCPG